jgi:PIN domain nuclease of toxin-antitoxin system
VNDGFLLDTNVLIWTLSGNSKTVSGRAKRVLGAVGSDSSLTVSVVSVWEIVIKHQARKLDLTCSIDEVVNDILYGFPWTTLLVKPEHILALLHLPLIHKDPFDRLLIAQARSEGLTIVTPDEQIGKYEIPTLW